MIALLPCIPCYYELHNLLAILVAVYEDIVKCWPVSWCTAVQAAVHGLCLPGAHHRLQQPTVFRPLAALSCAVCMCRAIVGVSDGDAIHMLRATIICCTYAARKADHG